VQIVPLATGSYRFPSWLVKKKLVQTQVDIAYVPDYLEFVAPENEMWLHHISTKLRALAYSSVEQFLADFRLMVANCQAYNSPGNGKFGGPGEAAHLNEYGCAIPPPPPPLQPVFNTVLEL